MIIGLNMGREVDRARAGKGGVSEMQPPSAMYEPATLQRDRIYYKDRLQIQFDIKWHLH